MKRKALLFSLISLIILFIVFFYIFQYLSSYAINVYNLNKTVTVKDDKNLFKVTRVVDGDTIEIEGGEKVRYIGINTPETVDPRKPVECFGKEASDKNKELVEGKIVRMEKDISETDKYKRLLRYVYVGNTFVNLELVKAGYAQVSTFPPDVKYKDVFLKAQEKAREENLGLWLKCR